LNYTVTPNLTLELYAQPFVSAGTFTNVRELSATPDADAFDERYQAYAVPADYPLSFKVTSLNSA
jgi:hypothetical protein